MDKAYRYAHVYQNHEAIRRALHGFPHDQVYITSKIALEEQVNLKQIDQSIQSACECALQELGIDCLDLYLIHALNRSFPINQIFQAMHRLIEQGKVQKSV